MHHPCQGQPCCLKTNSFLDNPPVCPALSPSFVSAAATGSHPAWQQPGQPGSAGGPAAGPRQQQAWPSSYPHQHGLLQPHAPAAHSRKKKHCKNHQPTRVERTSNTIVCTSQHTETERQFRSLADAQSMTRLIKSQTRQKSWHACSSAVRTRHSYGLAPNSCRNTPGIPSRNCRHAQQRSLTKRSCS